MDHPTSSRPAASASAARASSDAERLARLAAWQAAVERREWAEFYSDPGPAPKVFQLPFFPIRWKGIEALKSVLPAFDARTGDDAPALVAPTDLSHPLYARPHSKRRRRRLRGQTPEAQ